MKEIVTVSYSDIRKHVALSEEEWDSIKDLEGEARADAIKKKALSDLNQDFLDMLKGKSLEEQMDYFRVEESSCNDRTAYGQITRSNMQQYGCALKDYNALQALIVEDGVIIGIVVDTDIHSYGSPAFPYQTICTYCAIDNDGAGTYDREDYMHLCLVKPEAE